MSDQANSSNNTNNNNTNLDNTELEIKNVANSSSTDDVNTVNTFQKIKALKWPVKQEQSQLLSQYPSCEVDKWSLKDGNLIYRTDNGDIEFSKDDNHQYNELNNHNCYGTYLNQDQDGKSKKCIDFIIV